MLNTAKLFLSLLISFVFCFLGGVAYKLHIYNIMTLSLIIALYFVFVAIHDAHRAKILKLSFAK